jgi:transcriptional regulator with XRE-family HTH domain
VTPFGVRLRELRRRAGVTQKDMAAAIGVSPAYLSALEHGRRGAPAWSTVQKIIGYFNIIWDEAEELQRLAEMSHPRVVIDTGGLSAEATALANRLSSAIASLGEDDLVALNARLEKALARRD